MAVAVHLALRTARDVGEHVSGDSFDPLRLGHEPGAVNIAAPDGAQHVLEWHQAGRLRYAADPLKLILRCSNHINHGNIIVFLNEMGCDPVERPGTLKAIRKPLRDPRPQMPAHRSPPDG